MNVVLNARNRGTHTPKWAICTVEHPAASLDACDRDHRPSSTRYLPMLAMLAIAVLLTHFLSVSLSVCLHNFPHALKICCIRCTLPFLVWYSIGCATILKSLYILLHFYKRKKKQKTWKTNKKTKQTKQNTTLRLKFVLGLTSISCCCLSYYANVLVKCRFFFVYVFTVQAYCKNLLTI